MSLSREAGFSLIETFVVAAVMAAVLAAAAMGVSRLSQTGRKLDSNLSLSAAKQSIIERLSCAQTVESMPQSCKDGSGAAYLDVLDLRGRPILVAKGAKLGPFTLRARCNPSPSGGIEIRAAMLTGQGGNDALDFDAKPNPQWFKTDEVNKKLLYDWHPKGVLFGEVETPSGSRTIDTRLCKSFFGGSVDGVVSCASADEVMIGYNTLTQEPVCRSLSELIFSTTLATTTISTQGTPRTGTQSSGSSRSPRTGASGSGSVRSGFFTATAQICGSTSDGCQQCESRGLSRCGAAVGGSCSRDGYRCFNASGCRVFKCVVP